jgi:hypothetical protein
MGTLCCRRECSGDRFPPPLQHVQPPRLLLDPVSGLFFTLLGCLYQDPFKDMPDSLLLPYYRTKNMMQRAAKKVVVSFSQDIYWCLPQVAAGQALGGLQDPPTQEHGLAATSGGSCDGESPVAREVWCSFCNVYNGCFHVYGRRAPVLVAPGYTSRTPQLPWSLRALGGNLHRHARRLLFFF